MFSHSRILLPVTLVSSLVYGYIPSLSGGEATTNSVGMTMLSIPAGRFLMGQEERQTTYLHPITAEKDRGADWDELPVREVEISENFEMSATEVTNAQYEQFSPGHRKQYSEKWVSTEDDAAVVNVSWEDAMRFCRWLSEREGKPYRLPTEAEWEYACRAGTTTRYNTGDTLPDGYQQLTRQGFHFIYYFLPDSKEMPPWYRLVKEASLRVKRHQPNAWGLYDMHGNAGEWCLDWYAPYDSAGTRDPRGPREGESRIIRGGSHSQPARLLRSANRASMFPWARRPITGFRVVAGKDFDPVAKVPSPTPVTNAPSAANSIVTSNAASGYDPARPYFSGPTAYVRIPAKSKGPLYSRHNHDPAIACMPDGDVLVAWYSCEEEPGSELAVVSSRLHNGQWSEARIFLDVADANDHAPALFADGNTVWHFNGNKDVPGSVLRISHDSGRTWTAPVLISERTQPNEATIKTRDNRIIATFDGPDDTTFVHETRDEGRNWMMLSKPGLAHEAPGNTGDAIAGIHAAMVELANGDLLAFGRLKWSRYPSYDYKMPMSISRDGGRTWSYSISPFPAISSTQRATMKRLREGPILLCSFTDRLAQQNEAGKTIGERPLSERDGLLVSDGKGGEIRGYGLFAALSLDEGKTWPVRRLLTPGDPPRQIPGTDGKRREMSATQAELNGYLAMTQAADGKIHLVSSRNHYEFNLAWLTRGTPRRAEVREASRLSR
ncbi:hypothetical protein OpiT1DRAFT_01206 [Opitutaceae bacterium TAV1]|nr:hypothetical protein OpiT1DRAFT_01206 [Opitutaceae bacterium TAV1]